jgi:hypothetical protein
MFADALGSRSNLWEIKLDESTSVLLTCASSLCFLASAGVPSVACVASAGGFSTALRRRVRVRGRHSAVANQSRMRCFVGDVDQVWLWKYACSPWPVYLHGSARHCHCCPHRHAVSLHIGPSMTTPSTWACVCSLWQVLLMLFPARRTCVVIDDLLA